MAVSAQVLRLQPCDSLLKALPGQGFASPGFRPPLTRRIHGKCRARIFRAAGFVRKSVAADTGSACIFECAAAAMDCSGPGSFLLYGPSRRMAACRKFDGRLRVEWRPTAPQIRRRKADVQGSLPDTCRSPMS